MVPTGCLCAARGQMRRGAMKQLSLSFALLVACGDSVVIPGDDGSHQGGTTVSVSQGVTSTTTSSASATGGAGGFGGEAGAGGAGGDPSVPVARLVTVESFDGSPESNVHVVGHDADGEVIDHQLTASDGTASVLAPNDGMVTVGYESVVVLPDGNGGSETIGRRNLFTLASLGDRAELSYRMTISQTSTENPPMTLSLDAALPAADTVEVFVLCRPGPPFSIAGMGTASLEVRGCPGEPTFDLEVVATGMNMSPGRKIFHDVAHQPGQTVALTIAAPDLEPQPVDHVFSSAAIAVGLGPQGNVRSVSTNFGGSSSSHFSTPLSDGVSVWWVRESVSAIWRTRLLTTIPASSSWAVPALQQPWSPQPTNFAPQRPELTWSYQGNGSFGDALQASWFATDPAQLAVWSLFLPPGTTHAIYPALPAAMQPLVPGSAPGCGFNLYALIAESPGAGIAELFAFAAEDQVGAPSQFVGCP
jgi:hypothetical protein